MAKKAYPALKIQMGNWEYYSIRMKYKDLLFKDAASIGPTKTIKSYGELKEEDNRDDDPVINEKNKWRKSQHFIKFERDLEKPSVLDHFMQRELNEGRAKKSITNYLLGRTDRFFGSVVISCLGEIPNFDSLIPPKELLEDIGVTKNKEEYDEEKSMQRLGYISLDTEQDYLVLDGQHRLFAMLNVLYDGKYPLPEDYAGDDVPGHAIRIDEEEVNVLLVSQGEEDDGEWKQKYRRLFTGLNRYAKPTSASTNIIMDEDDIFSIVTRMLVNELPVFSYHGDPKDNQTINISTKNLQAGRSVFTSLEALYKFNESVLKNATNNLVWGSSTTVVNKYKLFRPDENFINSIYLEIKEIWDALFEIFPEWNNDRTKMRDHNAPIEDESNTDHFLLWPIGLEFLADLIREILDSKATNPDFTNMSVKEVLEPLGKLEWDFRKAPFNNVLLVDNENQNARVIISPTPKPLGHVKEIYRQILNTERQYTDEDFEELKIPSFGFLSVDLGDDLEAKEQWWEDLEKVRENFNN